MFDMLTAIWQNDILKFYFTFSSNHSITIWYHPIIIFISFGSHNDYYNTTLLLQFLFFVQKLPLYSSATKVVMRSFLSLKRSISEACENVPLYFIGECINVLIFRKKFILTVEWNKNKSAKVYIYSQIHTSISIAEILLINSTLSLFVVSYNFSL